MSSLPLFFKLENRLCVVVGGGQVAYRKVQALQKTGADILVIAPKLCEALAHLSSTDKIRHITQAFAPHLLAGAHLVIAATDDEKVNQQVSIAAQAHHIPVNVVDAPPLCTVTFGAIVDRAPITIAISSEGTAPVLAKHLRTKLEAMLPANYGRLGALANQFRALVKQRFNSTELRRKFWEDVFTSPVVEQVLAGQEAQAHATLQTMLDQADHAPKGEVYLVGGGPGDPDLLTFRALRLMQQCDVCVYDKLVSPEVLALVRRDAEQIYVGKSRDQHTLAQTEINVLLVDLALAGKRVLRLKGGDPFIFGRGGEEIETLMQQGVPFQVVPGITAANGVSSYAGIPLTHRDYAQACLFITGHLKNQVLDLDWAAMARPQQTVVVYMGLVGLPQMCEKLIQHGVPPTMPAAVVQQGTTQKQRVLTATLADLNQKVEAAQMKAPCLIIIGEVVKLREKLNWFTPQNAL